jgi:hypothetical protein
MHHTDSTQSPHFTRRAIIWGSMAFGGLLLLGCSAESQSKPAAKAKPKAAAGPQITMYKDPNCGCCGKWGEAARAAGFKVAVVDSPDIYAVKAKLGVPEDLVSCHTSLVGGYVVEGHVPLDAVKRLLREKPKLKGIAVPGMPLGSPGMEVPGGARQAFQVIGYDAAGKTSVFQA